MFFVNDRQRKAVFVNLNRFSLGADKCKFAKDARPYKGIDDVIIDAMSRHEGRNAVDYYLVNERLPYGYFEEIADEVRQLVPDVSDNTIRSKLIDVIKKSAEFRFDKLSTVEGKEAKNLNDAVLESVKKNAVGWHIENFSANKRVPMSLLEKVQVDVQKDFPDATRQEISAKIKKILSEGMDEINPDFAFAGEEDEV